MTKLFTGLITCKNCGMKYKYKLEGKKPSYVCSGYANKSRKHCSYFRIDEEELEYITTKHAFLNGKRVEGDAAVYVDHIEVDTKEGGYRIFYRDGTESIVEKNRIKY